uniref:S-type anion channel SLAH2-like n=1 Tax=Tanacetum cinerariifolium TaxID=118510 RepID=A0A6L2KIS9_TANCI|nr:S-type anion channel SLAH2-like [Tanacetum cinerariifolium]
MFPLACHLPPLNTKRVLFKDDTKAIGNDSPRNSDTLSGSISTGCGINKARAVETPDCLMLPIKSPRMDELRDNRYNSFKTWPWILANFANSGDGSGVRVTQCLQNPSTYSVFLHIEDFNQANPSCSNHFKRTHADIQAILPTCDMGIAWNVRIRGVTVGTTSTGHWVDSTSVVRKNSREGVDPKL